MPDLRLLCLGDNHGHVESLDRVVTQTAGRSYDFVIHVGDITNTCFDGISAGRQQLRALQPVFEQLNDRGPLVYVWGNRDFDSGRKGLGTRVDHSDTVDALPGTRLPGIGTVEVDGQLFTQVPEAVTDEAILVTHYDLPGWFDRFPGRLYLSGHAHVGRWHDRAVNTAFLYRDDAHEATPLVGGYFEITIEDAAVDVTMHSLGGLTAYDCETHGCRGTQYVPTEWDPPCQFGRDSDAFFTEIIAGARRCLRATDSPVTSENVVQMAVALNDDAAVPRDFEAALEEYLQRDR